MKERHNFDGGAWSYFIRGYLGIHPSVCVSGWELACRIYRMDALGYYDFTSIIQGFSE